MAVLVEVISVIVRLEAVRDAYAEEPERFLRRVPNATFCADDRLARIGFMSEADVRPFLHLLESDGLRHLREGQAQDVARVDQRYGALDPAPWLEVGEMDVPGGRVRACWLAGEPPGRLSVPRGWRYERSLSREHGFTAGEAFDERMTFVRRDPEHDVYVDRETGREVYVGRVRALEPSITELDALNARREEAHHEIHAASDEIDRVLRVGDVEAAREIRAELEERHLAALRSLADGFGRHVWQVHHQLGFLLRVLDRLPEAGAPLRAAYRLEPNSTYVLFELVLVLGEQEAHDEALPFARRGVAVAPDSVVARTNLAACLLGMGDVAGARTEAAEALRRAPDDATARYLLEMVEVAEGFDAERGSDQAVLD